MAEMLREPERDRLIAYFERRLLRTGTLDGVPVQALREVEGEFATAEWCWTADSAAALELLAQPQLRAAHAPLADGLCDTMLSMGRGELLLRRIAGPVCTVEKADPRDFAIVTDTHVYGGDLSRGVVRQSVRGGGARREVLHTGHLVEFRLGRKTFCLDVEDAIRDYGVLPGPDGAVVFHESRLKVTTGLLRQQERAVGTLRYEYTIRAGDPRLRLRVTLKTEPGMTLTNLRLTTALDEVSGEQHRPITRILLGEGGAFRAEAMPASGLLTVQKGMLQQISLVEDATAGDANGIHILPLDADRIATVKAQAQSGRLHWLLTRYMAAGLGGGESFSVTEERLLTAGTLEGKALADYGAMLADPTALSGRDPGLTADSGTALNAVATQVFFATAGAYDPPLAAGRLPLLRGWYDRHVEGFFAALRGPAGGALLPGRSYLRTLAFALLSLDLMHRATGEARYATLLEEGLELLLTQQAEDKAGGAFADAGRMPYLDCHAAAMVALARIALRRPQDARLATALRRALGAIRLGMVDVPLEDQVYNLDTPYVRGRDADGAWVEDGGFWSFKLGLLLRGLVALQVADAAGAVPLDGAERERLQTLRDTTFKMLRLRVRDLRDCLEVLTSPLAGEGNAATQPTVMLGLVAPDEAVARRAAAPALA
jgi:hypothetical protein